jgi:GT2 family glycosyltransferase
MKIHNHIVYSLNKNIGEEYNYSMNSIPDGDWVCFLDHDAMFTTSNWYIQLYDIIKQNPNYGLFTCMTNRVGMKYQIYKEIDQDNHNIRYHRNKGSDIQLKFQNTAVNITNSSPLSGVLMLISKETWKCVGGFSHGFLGVDNDIHFRCKKHNIQVGLMSGVYVYHWYRADKDDTTKPY